MTICFIVLIQWAVMWCNKRTCIHSYSPKSKWMPESVASGCKQARAASALHKQKAWSKGDKRCIKAHDWLHYTDGPKRSRLQPVMSLQTYTDGCQLVIWYRGITFLCFSFQVLNQCYSIWCSEQRCSSDHCILHASNVAWKAYTSWCMLLIFMWVLSAYPTA